MGVAVQRDVVTDLVVAAEPAAAIVNVPLAVYALPAVEASTIFEVIRKIIAVSAPVPVTVIDVFALTAGPAIGIAKLAAPSGNVVSAAMEGVPC